ncbi:hypothetical protein OPV22_012987 [Ensete ventricosum]|uniref:Secreted protein n=1 Tax=Ensete ventricosum TaxID=4639 RepID=A0AAV8R8P8_ENSVE|nr:hypothetical protein OPV22_012987 [Ensete ventricosum]
MTRRSAFAAFSYVACAPKRWTFSLFDTFVLSTKIFFCRGCALLRGASELKLVFDLASQEIYGNDCVNSSLKL